MLEAARSSKRDPDGTEAGRLERSLSVTGNFGAGSGSGALMKGSRFVADSMLERDGFEPSVPRRSGRPRGRGESFSQAPTGPAFRAGPSKGSRSSGLNWRERWFSRVIGKML